ncbi:unnamed protein product [Amoebophrya sp. A120]|nr:unnamed protein product [Amoebophrya sp. A120]|eukprot:GSA120T00012712001.1
MQPGYFAQAPVAGGAAGAAMYAVPPPMQQAGPQRISAGGQPLQPVFVDPATGQVTTALPALPLGVATTVDPTTGRPTLPPSAGQLPTSAQQLPAGGGLFLPSQQPATGSSSILGQDARAQMLNPSLYENQQFLQSSRQVSFAATELAFYQNLHTMADGADPVTGEIQGPEAAAFLAKSGLPKTMLHQIWQLADVNETGKLNVEEFYIALRLVAHAQNTGLVHPELIHTEPMTLPSFDTMSQRRQLSEPSEGGNTPSVIGGAEQELQVLGTAVDPLKVIESTARQQEKMDYLAKAQQSMSFNVTEQILYQKIFETLEPEDGEIQGTKKVSEFLESSGLPRTILHELWAIADEESTGNLNRVQFFILLRLIAHAQAADNAMPSPGLQFVEPPSLPLFDPNFVLAGGTTVADAAAAPAAAVASQPGAFVCEPLSRKERKKYAAIFLKTDSNGDGLVEGEEAKQLMQRSKLPNEFLAITWQLADRDNDGKLNFGEFLVAMHLITRCKKGDFRADEIANLPTLDNVLPGHVEALLSDTTAGAEADITPSSIAVNQMSEAAAQMTAASSPTATPQLESLIARSPEISYLQAVNSAAMAKPPPAPGTTTANFISNGNGGGDHHAANNTKAVSSTAPVVGASAVGSAPSAPSAWSSSSFQYQTAAIAPPLAPSRLLAAALGVSADPSSGSTAPPAAAVIPGTGPAASSTSVQPHLPRFGTDVTIEEPKPNTISATYLEDIAEADKRLARRTQQEVDSLEEALKTLNDKFEEMEREVRGAQREQERRVEQVTEREKQRDYLLQRLKTLTEERRAATVATFSATSSGSKTYFAEEMQYLENALREQVSHLESVSDANAMLEKQFHQADLHLQQLERQRRELEKETQLEKEALKNEERENSTLKTGLDGLQRKISVVNTNLALQQAEGVGAAGILNSIPNFGVNTARFMDASAAGASGILPYPTASELTRSRSENKANNDTEELGKMGGHSWSGLLTQPADDPKTGAGDAGKPKRAILPKAFDREGV